MRNYRFKSIAARKRTSESLFAFFPRVKDAVVSQANGLKGITMQRFLLIILLALASSNAMANWTKVDENSEFAAYGDRATIRTKGHIASMLSMYDFQTVQTLLADSAKYDSTKQMSAYDCRDEKTKMLTSTLYSNRMGKGRVVRRYKLQVEWQGLKARTASEALWRLACGKKVSHAE